MYHFVQLLILALFVSFSAHAENHLVFFGGGSSSEAGDSSFDKSLENVLDYSKKSSWKSEFFYRKNLPKDLSKTDKAKTKEFSAVSFREKIKSLIADINTGKIKPQDQLLVMIRTHGALVNGSLEISADTESVEVDSLKELMQAAENKGVKLGIIGGACYSGSLMKYMTPNTCLITSAQADRVGLSGDGTSFSELERPDKDIGSSNLEELYLEGRLKDANYGLAGQPMISTEAGVAIDEMLYPLKRGITHGSDIDSVIEQPICVNTSLAMQAIRKSLKDTTIVNEGFWNDSKEKAYPLLKQKMAEYDKLYQEVDDFNIAKNKVVCSLEIFGPLVVPSGHQFCKKVDEIDFKNVGSLFKPDGNLYTYERYLSKMRNTQEFREYSRLRDLRKDTIDKMVALSREISTLERQVYDQLYKKASKEFKGPNPCRDFKI